MRAASISPISAACRDFVIMAAADEAELVHMVATAAAIDDRPSALALSARRRRRRRHAGSRRSARDRQGPHRAAKERRWRCCRSARGSPNVCKAAETLAAHRLVHDGRRRALCQAARRRSGSAPGARARGADHRRGRRPLAASARTSCSAHRARRGSTSGLKVRCMILPDTFIDHDSPAAMYAKAGLDAQGDRRQGVRGSRQGGSPRSAAAGLRLVRQASPHLEACDIGRPPLRILACERR